MKKNLLTIFIATLIISTTAQPLSYSNNEIENFDTRLITKMINIVEPELEVKASSRIAKSLYLATRKYKIDPKLMIAIIGTESNFSNDKISTTGDLSLAQINPEIWNREFQRLGLDKLNPKFLKKNEAYALNKMAVILNILKSRHEKTDLKWFARYHSHTKKLKNTYALKIEKRMKLISSISSFNI